MRRFKPRRFSRRGGPKRKSAWCGNFVTATNTAAANSVQELALVTVGDYQLGNAALESTGVTLARIVGGISIRSSTTASAVCGICITNTDDDLTATFNSVRDIFGYATTFKEGDVLWHWIGMANPNTMEWIRIDFDIIVKRKLVEHEVNLVVHAGATNGVEWLGDARCLLLLP